MKVCYTGGAVKDCGSYYSVATNAVELRIWFLTDDILRIRAGFDGDWDEASYSLTMTAWESRTDELMKDCRKRVQSAAAALTDGDRQAARLNVSLCAVTPYRLISPPMLDPPMAVFSRSGSVGYLASMSGLSSSTIQSRYALPRPFMSYSCHTKS